MTIMDSGFGLAQLCTFLGLMGLSILCAKFPCRSHLGRKIKIHHVKMDKDMMHEAISRAIEEFEQYTDQTDIASHLRNFFQNKYGGIWHCAVGNSLGDHELGSTTKIWSIYITESPCSLHDNSQECQNEHNCISICSKPRQTIHFEVDALGVVLFRYDGDP